MLNKYSIEMGGDSTKDFGRSYFYCIECVFLIVFKRSDINAH